MAKKLDLSKMHEWSQHYQMTIVECMLKLQLVSENIQKQLMTVRKAEEVFLNFNDACAKIRWSKQGK